LWLTPSLHSTLLSVTAALCGQSPLGLSDTTCHAAEDLPAEATHGHSKRKALKNFLHKLRHGAEADTIPSAPSRQGEHIQLLHPTIAHIVCKPHILYKRCLKEVHVVHEFTASQDQKLDKAVLVVAMCTAPSVYHTFLLHLHMQFTPAGSTK